MSDATLKPQLRSVRRRLLLFGSASATARGLTAAVLLLLAAVWFDLLWELSPQWRLGSLVVSAAAGLALVLYLLGRTAREGRDPAVARRLDRAAGYGGDVITGWELQQNAPKIEPSRGMAEMAVSHAVEMAARVPRSKAVPAKPVGRALGILFFVLGGVALLAICMPSLARTQWDRFTNPKADVPPFSQTTFEVEPGDVDVVYGNSLDIHARVLGVPVEQVELVLVDEDGTEEKLPMFPEASGRWRAVLSKVTEPASYYVRAHRARSSRYKIGLITVPRIEKVAVEITPPAYAHKPGYKGPLPIDGVVGLRGTQVRITATSNRPLSGGRLIVETGAEPIEIEAKPVSEGASEAFAEFAVETDGKFDLRLIDVGGQESHESFSGAITLLIDQRPFIRLTKPRKRSMATPTTVIPIEIRSEDDCGISRVQLFRSLNNSRPLPTDMPLPEIPPTRSDEALELPLAAYGLEPGDVIKLFGRVEDNDPDGAKGSESTLATIEIISQEQFESMLHQRKGLEVLMSKYREARRRMEGMAEQAEGLRKKLKDQNPESPAGEETRQELERMLRRLRKESAALKKLTKNRMPYDLDKNLNPHLEDMAKMTDEMAEELEKLLKEKELNNEQIQRQLKKMTSRLSNERNEFDQQASLPLEMLETVFPLAVDQSRFMMIVLRQIDIAERLAALKGRDGEDDPALKTRMRDLEEEQRGIRNDLSGLLDDIENHVQRLPEDEKFDMLRDTATKFVKDVRDSGALEAMAEAEAGLAEFSGTTGHAKAEEAAEILKKFLKQCQGGGMGKAACDCLVFQPGMGGGMGMTVQQLLAGMGFGMGNGPGSGMGSGGSGGFGSTRGWGLYGALPGMEGMFGQDSGVGNGEGDDPAGELPDEGHTLRNPDQTHVDSATDSSAGGFRDISVPARFKRRVGEYFRRVAEETEE